MDVIYTDHLKQTFRKINNENESIIREQINALKEAIHTMQQNLQDLKNPAEAEGKVKRTVKGITDFMENYAKIELNAIDSVKQAKHLTKCLEFLLHQLEAADKNQKDMYDNLIAVILNLDGVARVFTAKESCWQRELDDSRKLREKIADLERKNTELKKQLQQASYDKDDALNRQSKLAGNKMKVGNPDISDPSDPNRPRQLSDEFGELYCNEWTDAFEYLQKKATKGKSAFAGYHTIHVQGRQLEVREKGSIDLLLEALKNCYDISKEDSDHQRIAILNAVTGKSSNAELDIKLTKGVGSRTVAANYGHSWSTVTPLTFLEQEKDIRIDDTHKLNNAIREFQRNLGTETVKFMTKIIAEKAVSKLRQDHTEKYFENANTPDQDKLRIYVDKCAQLCWLMRIQFPPVHLKFDIQGYFDGKCCTPYLTSGEKVLFPVWPAMFLHEENGALLRKGVVECKGKI